jgi:hypothetical protein
VSLISNTMSVTNGVETTSPSGALELTPGY